MIGIIADDVTGASDIAGRLVRDGTSAVLHFGVPDGEVIARADAGAVVIALPTRTAPVAEALAVQLAAAEWLMAHGAGHLYVKVSSTFDSTETGNIGPVLDALAQRVKADKVIVSPAAPEHGRTVYRSHLFVGDRLVSESSMRDHPLTPMRDPDLRSVLGRQSHAGVGWLHRDLLVSGPAAARARIAASRGLHVVADALDDDDLDRLAELALDGPMSAGATGLGAAIARRLQDRGIPEAVEPRPAAGPLVILSGSCSEATRAQVRNHPYPGASYLIDPELLSYGRQSARDAIAFAVSAARAGAVPLIYSSADPARVAAAQQALGTAQAAGAVEAAFGEIASALVDEGFSTIVVAGGETSGAVVEALGAASLRVGREVAPGVPWLQIDDERAVALLLKSGNFGGPDFFERAIRDAGRSAEAEPPRTDIEKEARGS